MHHCSVWVCLLYVLMLPRTHKQCWFMASSGFSLCLESAVTCGSWMSELHVWLTQVCSSVTMESSSARQSVWLAGMPTLVYHAAGWLAQWRRCSTGAVAMGSQTGICLISYGLCVFCDAPSLRVHQSLGCAHPKHCHLSLFDRMGIGQMGYVGAMHRKSRRQDPLLLSPTASLPQ